MKKAVLLPQTNLYLIGKGMDINGNSIIKFRFDNEKRSFSIQSTGTLDKTASILRLNKDILKINPYNRMVIRIEVVDYLMKNDTNKSKKLKLM